MKNRCKTWAYDEPGFLEGVEYDNHHVVRTEEEILNLYYDSWCEKMYDLGKLLFATEDNCIMDWITVNWAYETSSPCNMNIVDIGNQ